MQNEGYFECLWSSENDIEKKHWDIRWAVKPHFNHFSNLFLANNDK